MKKIIARILLFVFIVNAILANITFSIFAESKPKQANVKADGLWNPSITLNDKLEVIERPKGSDQVLLKWNVKDSGEYKLTYPIADGKEIEFKFTKNGEQNGKVEYRVNGNNQVNASTPLLIYKDGQNYIPANNQNFPPGGNFELDVFAGTGGARSVTFKNFKNNSGIAFKYQDNTIKFNWKGDEIYFVTDKVQLGNIYPFKLSFKSQTSGAETVIAEENIFLGIKINQIKPFANANQQKPDGQDIIDQTGQRPIKEYPGENIIGISFNFDSPKEWDTNNNKYEFATQDLQKKKATTVKFDLTNNDSSKLEIEIPNIYNANGKLGNNGITINRENVIVNNSGANDPILSKKFLKVRYSYKNGVCNLIVENNNVKGDATSPEPTPPPDSKLKHLEHSTIFANTSISTQRPNDTKFKSPLSLNLGLGAAYTYLRYGIIALGPSEFYLEIDPFKKQTGFYTVYMGSLQTSLEKLATYEITDANKTDEKILISVPFNIEDTVGKFFRVDFTPVAPDLEGKTLTLPSQILHFVPKEEDLQLSTPKNLEIVRSHIIRTDEEGSNGQKENLFITFKWDIDNEDTLKNIMKNFQYPNSTLNIKYSFFKGLKPDEFDQMPFLGVNLNFKQNQNNIAQGIEYTLGDGFSDLGIELITGPDKTFTSEREEIIGNTKRKILEANVTFKIPVSSEENKAILKYPNTYFIANQGSYTITEKDGSTREIKTSLSLPVTLTLNGVENLQVPPPQDLKVLEDTVTNNGFSVDYSTLKYKTPDDLLYNYNEIMLKTINRELRDESIKYDFYITQNKKLFEDMIKYSQEYKDGDTIPDYILQLKDKINDFESTGSMVEDGLTFNFKDLSGDKNEKLIDTLRKKGIVKISNIDQNIELNRQKLNFIGLDENETYYVIGNTNVTPFKMKDKLKAEVYTIKQDSNDKPLENKKDSSIFSKMVTATTKKEGDNPEENEKVPPAPPRFVAEEITLNSVELVWDKVKDNLPEGEQPKSTLEYQFIKTRGEQLPEAFLKSKDSFIKTWEGDYLKNVKDKEGIKTSKDNEQKGVIYEFDKENKQFSTTPSPEERYKYVNWQGSEGRIKDSTLSPNQIYFYYIRTVRVSENGDEAYSVWVPLTVTTKNTTGPKNLRIEYDAEYNKKSEVVISFDIPKMDLDLIGTEYDLQYSLKEDLGEWSVDKTMPKDKLTFKDNDDGKTMKVTYKISGLKSGTMYTIRVRMLNIPLNAPSIYSNEVEHRTDSDNDDNDYDEDVENWEKYFKDLVEELKNQPYWFGKDTVSETLVYYRPQYFDKIIATTNNSIIDLAIGKGGSYKEYYLPASAVIAAFDQNKGFKISYNDADVIFSPKTINPYDNDVIKKMAEEMESKKDFIKDYFIKLTVDFKNNKYIIDGSNSLSPSANIQMSVVGTRTPIIEWDQTMLDYIDELLETKEFSKEVKKKIEQLIKDKTDNKIMIQEVGKIFESFKSKFANNLTKDLNKLIRKTMNIQYLTNDIIFVYKLPTDISISGYKKVNGNWISIGAKDYLGKKAIYTRETGEYIFAGKKVVINGVGNLPNGNQITNIVVKYGLDDFLGKDGNINLRAPMTRQAAIGSLARVAGASRTQDPIEFFKSKGIILSTRNMNNNITSEEAVYLIMKVYEMKSGTKLETVKIRNYNLTKDIKNINNNYKKPIQVAFETGIYNNPNMNPKGTITVQEFLQSLANMSTMIGI